MKEFASDRRLWPPNPMESLPASWATFCVFALAVGARHGLDADHLATIDSLTRYNGRDHPRLARLTGLCFSLGHGAVVLGVAIAAALLSGRWKLPEWLDVAGSLVSMAVLLGLGWINLRSLFRPLSSSSHAVADPRHRLLRRFSTMRSPIAVAIVGALFALSFDTLSLAAVFAFAAERFGGVTHTIAAAALFVVAMACVDGANGIWISRLVHKANATADSASRILSIGVVATSAAVALFVAGKLASPIFDQWAQGRDWLVGLVVTAAIMLAFAFGIRVARRRERAGRSGVF